MTNPIKNLTKCYEAKTLIETILSFQAEKSEKEVWGEIQEMKNPVKGIP